MSHPGSADLFLAALAAALCGLSTGLLAWWVHGITTSDRPDDRPAGLLEVERRRSLRLRSWAYRRFEPLVNELADRLRRARPGRSERLDRDLVLAQPVRWSPEEFQAVRLIEGVLVGLAATVFGVAFAGPTWGICLGIATAILTPFQSARDAARDADFYRARVRARLPLAIDLMALMLEAEATLPECLATVAEENRGHPIGFEFALLRSAIENGIPLNEALKEMARRLDDPDVSEFVITLTSSGENPSLNDILRGMAGPMRGRRMQQLEKASEVAKVNMTWPAMVIMVACLLIVLAVFVLEPVGAGR